MDCENCGARIPDGADTCAECGEPTAAMASETGAASEPVSNDAFFEKETDALAPDSAAAADPTMDAIEPEKPGALSKKAVMIALAVLVVLGALLAVAFFVPFGGATLVGKLTNANDPMAVAQKMLTAYAKYDAKGMLATTNSSAMSVADQKTFETEAAAAKTRAGGKDGVKGVKVIKVTKDPKDPNKATAEVSGQWLEDPAKGTYTQRTDQLPMIQQGGKWVVQLF